MKLRDWDVRERVRASVSDSSGTGLITGIWVLEASEHCVVIHVECKHKYPKVVMRSASGISIEAIGGVPLTTMTASVNLDLPPGFDICATDADRYAISIYCCRPLGENPVVIWER